MSLLSDSSTDEESMTKARKRLQAFLRESNLYRVQFLLGETTTPCEILTKFLTIKSSAGELFILYFVCLGKMENCEQLLLERATLHGKLEEHDKALHILVHKLRDFPSAEAFCVWASSSRDPAHRQRLFHLLLEVYLGGELQARAGGGELEMAAVDLLNRHGEVFDAVRVLRVLPEGWSLQLLRPFLNRAIRASMHARHTSQIAVGLAHSENVQLLHDRVRRSFN